MQAGNAEILAAADAWVAAAVAAVGRWRAEDARAVQTLDLMGVASAERELPTRRELPGLIASLRAAWQERSALPGGDAQQRGEVEALIEELESMQGASPASAAAGRTPERETVARKRNPAPPALNGELLVDPPFTSLATPLGTPLTSPLAAGGLTDLETL
mmetsp:Transcript_42707/g.96335  ORF Transcript_42707/g.96335 Transcript_42707/m.96335 type:complete len:160 (-) Transcript_42707:29-508(-)